jgi:AcrR family transcriptional regulator
MGMELGKDDLTIVATDVPAIGPAVRDDTRERILDAALTVLRDVGHGQFSVQKVARQAGVYQGNITYYWPRRRDLVRALAVRIVEDYRRSFLAGVSLGLTDGAPTDRAEELVRAMVEDATSPDRVRLLPELWSIANADPEVALAVTRCYEEVTELLLVTLGAGPDRSCSTEVRRVLFLIGIAVQGLTAVHGHRGAGDPVLSAVSEAVVGLHGPLLAAALAGCDG